MTGLFAAISTASSAVERHAVRRRRPERRRCRWSSFVSFFSAAGVEDRVQQLIELRRSHAQHGGLLVDQAFVVHLDRDANRRRTRALAVAGLQHVQRALLHGELEVLHVLVVLFELGGDLDELVVDVLRSSPSAR